MPETKRHLTDEEKRVLYEAAINTTDRLTALALRREVAAHKDGCFACVLKSVVIGMLTSIAHDVAFLSQGDDSEAAELIALFTKLIAEASIDIAAKLTAPPTTIRH